MIIDDKSTEKLMDAIMKEIDDELRGFFDEYGGTTLSLEEELEEVRIRIHKRIIEWLSTP